MFKSRLFVPAIFAGVCLPLNTFAAGFADVVLEYNAGAGAASGFTNTASVLGQPTASTSPFSPAFQKTQLLSIGAGGSLTVQFLAPILNDVSHPFGLDFNIFGNTGFVITNGNFSGGGITDGSLLGNNTGATRVSISQDNVTYYQLNPALARAVDGLYPTDGTGNFNVPVDPALSSSSFAGLGLAGIGSLYGGSAGGTGFDISWAQDGLGASVALDFINYIRVDVISGKSEIDGFAAVPEPAAFSLALLIAPALLFRRRATLRAKVSKINSTND